MYQPQMSGLNTVERDLQLDTVNPLLQQYIRDQTDPLDILIGNLLRHNQYPLFPAYSQHQTVRVDNQHLFALLDTY